MRNSDSPAGHKLATPQICLNGDLVQTFIVLDDFLTVPSYLSGQLSTSPETPKENPPHHSTGDIIY